MQQVLFSVVFPVIAGLLIFLMQHFIIQLSRERDKWKSPKLQELREVISDKHVRPSLKSLAKEQVDDEVFFIRTGIRLRNPNELEPLLKFKRELGGNFGWQSIRIIYPMHLCASDGTMNLRFAFGDKLGHYILNLLAVLLILSTGLFMLSVVDDGRKFLIGMAIALPVMMVVTFVLQYLDMAYRTAKFIQKHLNEQSAD
ncbi:hypothetical protein ACWGNA_27200 [Brucella cytisi]|uniref:Uncharacterized protein n=1 Tax=Brucella cytisi TaxID=407152 RepID=A0A1J6HMM8_9HYPH|nr:hypothetical protein [Brucella cytisi]OIS94180.1 hypothetical protein BLA27_06535 [Brucella cytisi]